MPGPLPGRAVRKEGQECAGTCLKRTAHHVVQRRPPPGVAAATTAPPGHTRAPWPRRPGAPFPYGPDRPGGDRPNPTSTYLAKSWTSSGLWRPTPLVRATRLETALGTPARIYYKDESVSPAGSHKPNTAVPQAFYNKAEGVDRLTTETGAGQWGSASVLCLGAVRPRVQGLHGPGVVRAKAVPPGDDGDLGRAVSCPARWTTRSTRVPWARRSATPCAMRWAAPTPTTRSGRYSTTCCCTKR